ncbi:M56 family metallopeptidase [Saccharopolyspora sp. SCSIO 74807]|uniref:M56 family metallopeptidase n=1 Tax=Saccharopolyspora sp. SCSIO 74807 TaxID=3118084 RepID=UPI0030D4052D
MAALLIAYPEVRALGFGGHPLPFFAMLLVFIGLVAVGNAVRVVAIGLSQTHRFHFWVESRQVAIPGPVAAVVHELGLRERVVVVDTRAQIAVTVGLLRPIVVISTGMAEVLSSTELRAVLAHEQAHARRRDPLRVLLARMLAAHLWFLPVAEDVRSRARRGYELAADRGAAHRYGRSALAGALLRVMSAPVATQGFVVPFVDTDLLEARVVQLESGQAPRPARVSSIRSALTGAGASGFLAAVAAAWLFVLLACPCAAT